MNRFVIKLLGGFVMKNKEYLPEGAGDELFGGLKGLLRAKETGTIHEARCLMCDADHNLHLKVCGFDAIIPRGEAALGVSEGITKDVAIITRVNKLVCFKVLDVIQSNGKTIAVLSRAMAQREYLEYIYENFCAGDILSAKITHLEQFGAFCDIGCGIVSMIPIDCISVSRIDHPNARFYAGMDVRVVIKEIDKNSGKISVSHKELLGTWQQNSDKFKAGQTVSGIVRSIEDYGIFIELTPNLAGLAELCENVSEGSSVSVYIKSIIPEKMKVKLAIVECTGTASQTEPIDYFYTDDSIKEWYYSPKNCTKNIFTVF